MDIFTIPTPPFNAKIRIQKKLLGNYAILREFENRYFRDSFQIFRAFSGNLSLFHKKQPVVCSISRDIFQIISDEIKISSEKIF